MVGTAQRAPLPTLRLPRTSGLQPLPLTVLLLRNPRRLGLGSLGAGHANLIAIGDAIGWRDDDAIIGGDARRQFNILAEVAGDSHSLELNLIVGADGGDAQ